MHVERNLSANLLKHLMGEKDTIGCRRDMEEARATPHLWLQQIPGSSNFLKPKAPYVFTDGVKADFLKRVSSTKTPTRFSSTLTKHLGEKDLAGLKSHDHHVLLEYITLVAVRHNLLPGARETIIRLGSLFQRICARVVDLDEIPSLLTYAAKTLSMLEVWFPPSFFDIMSHLPIHLVEELAMLGPVHSCWCYSVERYLGILTSYVRNTSKPEACMASGYAIDESLGFVTEYFALFPHTRRRVWDWEEEQRNEGELLIGKASVKVLDEEEIEQIHEYVITHSVHTQELYE